MLTQITTLIPAYKTKYMVELFTGLATQTHKPARILVSDDSPGGEFTEQLRQLPVARRLPIEVCGGPKKGAYENFKHLVRHWNHSSELFHILLDDDVLFPDFYARHVMAHAMAPDTQCSVSARWTANEQGQPIEGMPIPKGVWFANDRVVLLDSGALFGSTAAQCQNWLGEFSNCVMRPSCAAGLLDPRFGEVSYAGLWDLGAFLAASMQAPIAYIQDRLGYFRFGAQGNSAQFKGPLMKSAHVAYASLALAGLRLGQMSAAQTARALTDVDAALGERYGEEADMQAFRPYLQTLAANVESAEAQQAFLNVWNEYLARHGL